MAEGQKAELLHGAKPYEAVSKAQRRASLCRAIDDPRVGTVVARLSAVAPAQEGLASTGPSSGRSERSFRTPLKARVAGLFAIALILQVMGKEYVKGYM